MTKKEFQNGWNRVLELLPSKNVDLLAVNTFFRPLTPLKVSEKESKLCLLSPVDCPASFYQNMINNHITAVSACLKEVFGKPYSVSVSDKEEPSDSEEPYYSDDTKLDPKYTFESFVEGPNSKLAYAAAISVAEGYSRQYNPLFLYGGSGLGKTHLMHAIGHYVSRNRKKSSYIYVSAETFTVELIEAIRTKTQQAFRDKYRGADFLLFDDVQFIAGNTAVEDELFNTFEALYNSNRQIVFTSDRPPKELNGIPERLISRFSWGLPVDILPPQYETKVAILKNKAILEGLDVQDSNLTAVIDIIAKSIESNIRELEGSFTRVIAHAKFTGESITVQLAKRVLTDVFKTKESELTPQEIKKAVANYYKIKVSEMDSPNRSRNIAFPRQIAIYLTRELCPSYSLPKIGEVFGGRDHTTILHSYEKISGELKTSKELGNIIESIKNNLVL